MISRIRAWWHRHIVADTETSNQLDAVDQELAREERIRQYRLSLPEGRAKDYLEQMKEIK